MQVSTQLARDFGLAWRLNTLFAVPPADFNGDGLVGGSDFLAWQRNYGTLLSVSHALGDSEVVANLADEAGPPRFATW